MNAQIVIPARMGSTRLPRKPLLDIGGKPMLRRVWERCCEVPNAENVCIVTDSQEIATAVIRWDANLQMTAKECWSGTYRIASLVEQLDADLIVDVQGDLVGVDPLAVAHVIRVAADAKSDAMSVVVPNEPMNGAVKVARLPNGRAVFFSRNIEADWKEVGIYAYRRSLLKDYWKSASSNGPTGLELWENIEQMAFIEYGVHWQTCEWPRQMDSVNTPEDLERARSRYGAVTAG